MLFWEDCDLCLKELDAIPDLTFRVDPMTASHHDTHEEETADIDREFRRRMRNRAAAAASRKRKQERVHFLERTVGDLEEKVKSLKQENDRLRTEIVIARESEELCGQILDKVE